MEFITVLLLVVIIILIINTKSNLMERISEMEVTITNLKHLLQKKSGRKNCPARG